MISFLYYLYERRLLREIRERPVPRHLGLILDGNRRYALERGFVDPLEAYALGARKLDDMLLWCDELSIPAVSLWVLSTENFRRDASEVSGILETVEAISEETLAQYLYTPDLPDPDLIIRTSGEVRLSGFLLWQSAYSEFYFCDVHWPAFRKTDFLRAVRAFQQRDRRFGQ